MGIIESGIAGLKKKKRQLNIALANSCYNPDSEFIFEGELLIFIRGGLGGPASGYWEELWV